MIKKQDVKKIHIKNNNLKICTNFYNSKYSKFNNNFSLNFNIDTTTAKKKKNIIELMRERGVVYNEESQRFESDFSMQVTATKKVNIVHVTFCIGMKKETNIKKHDPLIIIGKNKINSIVTIDANKWPNKYWWATKTTFDGEHTKYQYFNVNPLNDPKCSEKCNELKNWPGDNRSGFKYQKKSKKFKNMCRQMGYELSKDEMWMNVDIVFLSILNFKGGDPFSHRVFINALDMGLRKNNTVLIRLNDAYTTCTKPNGRDFFPNLNCGIRDIPYNDLITITTLHRDLHAANEFAALVTSKIFNFENQISNYLDFKNFFKITVPKYFDLATANLSENDQEEIVRNLMSPNLKVYLDFVDSFFSHTKDYIKQDENCRSNYRSMLRHYVYEYADGHFYKACKMYKDISNNNKRKFVVGVLNSWRKSQGESVI